MLFSGKVGDYKMLFVATRKCRSTDEFLNRVEEAVERGARQSMPLVLAGNLLELLKPAMEQLKENRHEEKEETKYE